MPPLPPEIWLQILDIATVVPSELNANAASIFERSTHLEAQQARQRSLPTRRALPLVCRTFYALATQFLYKSILIRKGKNARRLLDTFGVGRGVTTNQPDGVNRSTCHGRWTKRLDIDIKRSHYWDKTAHGELLHLLPLMPNLAILVCLGSWDLPDDRILIKGLQSCQNLKMVYLPPDMLPKYEKAIFHIATTPPLTSSLRIFYPNHPGFPAGSGRKAESYFDSKQCCNLRALTSSDAWIQAHAAQDPSYFPHLCTLHVFGEIYEPFLAVHGYKVTTLDLEVSRWDYAISTIKYFPNLRNIILDIVSVIDLARIFEYANAPISSGLKTDLVKLVGMTINSTQARHAHYSWVFKFLPVIFPKMEQLRILERYIVNSLCKQPGRVRRWHAELAEKRIRLEREDGELLIEDCQKYDRGLP
jgi:hypothetical protein